MPSTAWFASTPSLIGYLGAGIVVLTYFLNQKGLLESNSWRFPAMNLAGSVLVMLSLYYQPNPPSVVIEIFWSTISIYGIQKYARAARIAPTLREENLAPVSARSPEVDPAPDANRQPATQPTSRASPPDIRPNHPR